ncbi:MAG: hypothetical protein M1818_006804 [Claussenomyces sp. TS43310]|nr:MAG: hypothetical protein M1818_006804 [Claussenomyces sp. TS43310]
MSDMQSDQQNIHSFFRKSSQSKGASPSLPKITATPRTSGSPQVHADRVLSGQARDVLKEVNGPDEMTELSPPNIESKLVDGGQTIELREVDPNLDRRKRQKISSLSLEGTNDSAQGAGDNVRIDEFGSSRHVSLAARQAQLKTAAVAAADGPYNEITQQDSYGISLPTIGSAQSSPKMVALEQPRALISSSGGSDHGQAEVSHPQRYAKSCFEAVESTTQKPKKFLHFNPKTGTIGSPPAKKSTKVPDESTKKLSPDKLSKQLNSLIVKIRYGRDGNTRSMLSKRIDEMLQVDEVLTSTSPSAAKSLLDTASLAPRSGPKQTHPFFLGKIAPKQLNLDYPAASADALPRTSKPFNRSTILRTSGPRPQVCARDPVEAISRLPTQGFKASNKMMKCLGAAEPIWPPKGMVHVKDDGPCVPSVRSNTSRPVPISGRKSKYISPEAQAEEDVLRALVQRLDIATLKDSICDLDADSFITPEKSLRLPQKHFETGHILQRRVRGELSSYIPVRKIDTMVDTSEDELHHNCYHHIEAHPALREVYENIATSLTALDRSEYETQSWIYKHAPSKASGVLQTGRESSILKEWLQARTVMTVDTGSLERPQGRGALVATKKHAMAKAEPIKRKRKTKLEGFVVSSDEEEYAMGEISEAEDSFPHSSQGAQKRTLIRTDNDLANTEKLTTSVVISGPSGCGKTAMVYAVAQELGFEVFEINASCRRSGKDVMERVGDMTKNHLVHLSETDGNSIPGEDLERLSDALAADLKSGRQGTMNAFFNTKTPKAKVRSTKKQTEATSRLQKTSLPVRNKKQSLILLEEVDILYDEDKQFWATVMELISQSKRPIIMTCNDETVVPLHALPLHAVMRLTPPPVDLAVDYMLLVAAYEGHALKRSSIKALYQASKHDLRASMMELEFWCQIGVGDRRGGLEWFYPRWPIGSDVDEHGKTIRVVSEGTYKKGMGWLGRDLLHKTADQSRLGEEILRETWHGWQIDAGDQCDLNDLDDVDWCKGSKHPDRYTALSSYEKFAEAMSLADICGFGSLAVNDQILLDTTAPSMSPKSRDDYVIGYALLQAEPLVLYENIAMDISFWIKAQASKLLQSSARVHRSRSPEARAIDKIIRAGQQEDNSTSRRDFSLAFDAIAESDRNITPTTSWLESSVFDRTITMIAVDVAPFVRSIVACDARLQKERVKRSNLLSEGGKGGKRMRTTRSAFSALEGGARNATRKERYFGAALNTTLVLKTGLQCWQDAIMTEEFDPLGGNLSNIPTSE